uniref:Proline rich mitotic checkpoint control factor n=1 Tax=Anolis carolinensis TaxID=28377 RepID=A0A803T0G4_ANOCA
YFQQKSPIEPIDNPNCCLGKGFRRKLLNNSALFWHFIHCFLSSFFQSDSEEDEPVKKQPTSQGHGEGTGLSALLPQPKNLTVKETNRPLLPYVFSRKAAEKSSEEPKGPASTVAPSKPKAKPSSLQAAASAVTTTPSPSAIKAAAKSATLQVTKQITQEENESDEEVAPENYFSLPERREPPAPLGPEPFLFTATVVPDDLPPGTEPEDQDVSTAANAPLEFKTVSSSSAASHGWAPKPGEEYGSQPYPPYPGYSEFKRLQGKRNRGREEINFVEIKGDDQLSGAQQWLTKSLTEEQNMKSFSKVRVGGSGQTASDASKGALNASGQIIFATVGLPLQKFILYKPSMFGACEKFAEISSEAQECCSKRFFSVSLQGNAAPHFLPFKRMSSVSLQKKGEQPTGQQRRKHQITYLIHQVRSAHVFCVYLAPSPILTVSVLLLVSFVNMNQRRLL